jgi:hypothetical protein
LQLFDAEELLKVVRAQLGEKAAEQLRTWSAKSEMERKNTLVFEQFRKPEGSFFSHWARARNVDGLI